MLDRAAYERFRVSPVDPASIRVGHVEAILGRLSAGSAGRLTTDKFAESFEGRPIFRATIGHGPRRVLLWSQMHGDEPTHTAVLLDLLSYLLQAANNPHAADILAGCTLFMLPLLNPDGAERFIRFNAQDIDVNRDARRLATPEGRALRRAVETLRPQFAFNLHNQNARTAVGRPPKAAIASLLAPPPDEQRTETDAVRKAKQVAACFVKAVRADVDHVDGMISKYDDTYEPRAFGDWVQSTGAATVLVEAGGWPAADAEPIVRLHFHGLLAALQAIATDDYRHADAAIYDALPFSNETNLADCLITGGRVVDAERGTEYIADIAINHSHGHRLPRGRKPDGTISDVGDLGVLGAKQTIDANNCVVMPGRCVFIEEWNLNEPLDDERIDSLLAAGVTSAIGMVHPTNRDEMDRAAAISAMPIHWGFVVRIFSPRAFSSGLLERLAYAVSQGAMAIAGDSFSDDARRALGWLGVPLIEIDRLPKSWDGVGNDRQLAEQTWRTYQLLGIDHERGRVRRGFAADLQILNGDALNNPNSGRLGDALKRVLVAGETVWENGKRTGKNPGVLLRGR